MNIGEAVRFSIRALRSNALRTLLTSLGMVIGNASVILVVTIALTSRDYILEQVQGVGSNLIYAYSEVGGQQASHAVAADYLKLSDVEAVRRDLGPRIIAASGVMTVYDRILIGGKERDIAVIGADQQYRQVRNLVILAGRFMDASDVALNAKVAVLTEKLAERLFGGQQEAVGKIIKIHGLQFTIVGTFKERVESFGLSELAKETIAIPITVIRYFSPVERIDPLYVQVARAQEVEAVTGLVRQIIESRHRPGALYRVENLAAILEAAKRISFVLEIVLVLISAVALIISGIGIMNIMLVTVTERTREIGIRMAVGASRRDILLQFLTEAVVISLAGGLAGILVGVAIPLSVRLFAEGLRIPISPLSIATAFGVSCIVGLIFGILPANRAARLNPTEALRYE